MLALRKASNCRVTLTLSQGPQNAWSTRQTLMPMIQQRGKAFKPRESNFRTKVLKNKGNREKKRYANVWKNMNIKDLARALNLPSDTIFEMVLNSPDGEHIESDFQPLSDQKLIQSVAKQLNWHIKFVPDPTKVKYTDDEANKNLDICLPDPKEEDMTPRPPVVAIMGHIDHGKTTLLDCLRKSRIVEGEFGGITQHIGAFSVALDKGREVTFIDTPGHAAFKAMRSRGAYATDIVVLVVDVAEGVLEQTLESIKMIKNAQASMIVALNKIDRPSADIKNTKLELKEAGVLLEDFGGDVQAIEISALHGTNIPTLVEALAAQAEILQLKADYDGPVEGVVIESKQDRGLGKMCTMLVQRGQLKKGDFIVCGQTYARVRKLLDDRGTELKVVKPSQAAQVVGWKGIPSAGAIVQQVPSEKRAQEVVNWRQKEEKKIKDMISGDEIEKCRQREREAYIQYRMKKLEIGVLKPRFGRHDFHVRTKETTPDSDNSKLSILIKTDVDGSLEAILNCLDTYKEEDVALDIVDFGVGALTESDIAMAGNFNAVIYAFNTSVSNDMKKLAQQTGVVIKEHNIIYKFVDELKDDISSKLPLKLVDEVEGQIRVLETFLINEKKRKIPVAGCRAQSGKLTSASLVKVVRNGTEVYRGKVISLRHHKEEVKSTEQGKEYGVRVEDSDFIFQPDDIIWSVVVRYQPQVTGWNPGF